MKKRGYNQAQILAEEIGKTLGILVDTENLARSEGRRKYAGRMWVSGAKESDGSICRQKKLPSRYLVFLPVDDIYTTGDTIDAAARILKKCGVKSLLFNYKYWTRILIFVILKMMFKSL